MMLADVRDYVASLGLADHVYMGKLPDKQNKSIGVYNSKHEQAYRIAIGGMALGSYGIKNVTLLVHWNKSLRETEAAAARLFEAVSKTREAKINEATIKFIQPLYEPQDIGTDDAGICEMVIEIAVIFERSKNG